MKKISILSALLTALTILSGCGSQKEASSGTESASAANTGLYDETVGPAFSTDDGLYHLDSSNFLYFYDYNSEKDVLVCTKPNCTHEVWNENTPDEQKCDGYLGDGLCAGFISDGRLYILRVNPAEQQTDLIVSQLNRTEQKTLCTLPMPMLRPFLVQDRTLYLSGAQVRETEDENGMPQQTAESENWLMGVDLSTGKSEELSEKLTGLNADIEIIGCEANTVYFKYTYAQKEFTGTNYDEADFHTRCYAYDRKTGDYQQLMEQTGSTVDSCISDGILVAAKNMPSETEEGSQYAICRTELKSGEEEQIASAAAQPVILDDSVFYHTEKGDFCYSISSGKTAAMKGDLLEKFRCTQAAGDYYYGVTLSEGGVPCLIRRDDFKNGNENYIELKWQ